MSEFRPFLNFRTLVFCSALLLFPLFVGCADTDTPPAQSTDDVAADVVDEPTPDVVDEPDYDGTYRVVDAVPEMEPDRHVEPDEEVDEGDVVVPEDCDDEEDNDGDGRVDCHDSDCYDITACEGVPPAPWIEPRMWRRTWGDEFNGPEPGQEACYDAEVTPPQCLVLYWDNEDCEESVADGLEGLNTCNWSAFDLYNWMDNGKPIGEGVNNFDPEMVSVSGGTLILRSEAVVADGGLESGWTISRVMEEYDCGTEPDEGFRVSTDCPIRSGAVWSKTIDPLPGLAQTYGRFEIRARLPVGPGSWPAHWMLPQEGPWPGDGEIDIMEAVSFQPDFNPHEVGANFHDGVTVNIEGEEVSTHMSVGSMEQEMTIEQQRDEYHVFAVEWDAETLRFYVDHLLIGTVNEGTMLANTNLDNGEFVGNYPVEVPDEPFHMILNSTVAAFGAGDYPDPRTFAPQLHYIDFVRAWELCDSEEDFCPNGGDFDGSSCRLGAIPEREDLFVYLGDLVYPAEAGERPCPDGGELESDLCVLYVVDAVGASFMGEDGFFEASACVESTLSQSARCHQPCRGLGQFQDGSCHLGDVPEGSRGRIADDLFTYTFAEGDERCPIGRERPLYCEFGQIPEGRIGSVTFEGDAFFLNATCEPNLDMPNCPQPCPQGTHYDGTRCLVSEAPVGTSPFIYEDGFYYQYLDTETYADACPIGQDDSANCFVSDIPDGRTGTIRNDSFYVDASCGNVPSLSE